MTTSSIGPKVRHGHLTRARWTFSGTYSNADTATLQLTATPPSTQKLEISPCTKGKL